MVVEINTNMNFGGMIIRKGERKTRRKTCPEAKFTPQMLHGKVWH
jgi:hypothetical protein